MIKTNLLESSKHHHPQATIQTSAEKQEYDLNPTFTHYKIPKFRPTVAQLRKSEEQRSTVRHSNNNQFKIEPPEQEGKERIVGTFIGVLSPCFDNILNIVYFVRLPYVIATAGGFATIIGWIVSFLLTLISVFSLSAMATNGEVESGGAYYLVSRTIGPELGGAAGFCLAFASLIGAAQAHLGLMEVIVILYSPKTVFGSKIWDIRIFSALMSIIIGYLANFGFSIRLVCFFIIWLGVIMYFVGLIFPKYTKAKDIIGCSDERFKENWALTGLDISQIFYTFSIIFPGFGGILSGSNSSGQLKRPQVSIPLGSIAALVMGLVIFIATSLSLSGCHPKSQLISNWTIPIQDSSFLTWFTFSAIVATSVAKGITGIGSGPMVLRAMAADGIIHEWFGKFSRTFGTAFAVGFCLYGNFNEVSSLSSMLFLGVFAFLNQGVFLAKYAKVSSFRPHFKFYDPYVALITCILCLISMALINWVATLLTFIATGIFYYYLKQKHIDAPWGSLSHSNAYNTGLIAALRLRNVPPHPKLYRPNIAIFIHSPPSEHLMAITFLDQMLQKKGMSVVVRIFDPSRALSDVVKDRTNCSIKTTRNTFHTFYETVVARNMKEALSKVMLLTGLASMRPNVVFVEFDEQLGSEVSDFVVTVLENNWPLMIIRRPNIIEDFGTIDFWFLNRDGGLALLMASILSHKGRTLRVLTFARLDRGETIEEQGLTCRRLLKRYRVRAEVVVIPFTDAYSPSYNSQMIWEMSLKDGFQEDLSVKELTTYYMKITDAIRENSCHSLITVISLPEKPSNVSGNMYMKWLNLLSSIPPTVLFVHGNGTHALSWQV